MKLIMMMHLLRSKQKSVGNIPMQITREETGYVVHIPWFFHTAVPRSETCCDQMRAIIEETIELIIATPERS